MRAVAYWPIGILLLAGPAGLWSQSGWFPQPPACGNETASANSAASKEDWKKGREAAAIEGDGVMGIGNWGHIRETLRWYCQASKAGNAFATYDIAEIVREGYVVNSNGLGGRIITQHFDAAPAQAFEWYQLATRQGSTKGMLAVAQYYGLGDGVLKGSNVARNPAQALEYLQRAAQSGDTTALMILAMRYLGVRTAPWAMLVPIAPDATKAAQALNSVRKIFDGNQSTCTSPDAVSQMKALLPDESEGREVRGAAIVEVHGTAANEPEEIDCILSLSGPPPKQKDEPTIQQFYRLIHGGSVRFWTYSNIYLPNDDNGIVFRETATQAMVEGIQEMAALLQMALPPSSDFAPKPGSLGLNLAGSWEIDLPPTQGQTARTQLLRVDQVGTTVTISLVGGIKEVPIFKGKIANDNKIVGRSSDLLGSSSEVIPTTLTILDGGYVRFPNGLRMVRIDQ